MAAWNEFPEASYYYLEVWGHRLYLQGCGILAPEFYSSRTIHALLVLGRPEGMAALRKALQDSGATLMVQAPGQQPLDVRWATHLHSHPHIVARRIGPRAISALVLPRCSFLPHLQQCESDQRVVVGRTREELLHNAFVRLMALASIPMHPSWERPVMEHLEKAGPDAGLRLLRGTPALRAAIVYRLHASKTIEEMWKQGRLPDPSRPAVRR